MTVLDWPLPPPFMWVCGICIDLLHKAPGAEVRDLNCPYGDALLRLQFTLATHLVADHPTEVPEPHTDGCALCRTYASRGVGKADQVWAEHRARGLFLPESVARLL